MTALDIISAICPELMKSESVNVFLRMAEESLSRSFFADQFPFAVAYKACHLYTITAGSDGGAAAGLGEIASISEGGLSVSFATRSSESDATGGLETTKYGKMLLGLINSRPRMGVNTAGLEGGRRR